MKMKKLFTKTVVAEAVILAIVVCSISPTVMAAKLNLPTDPLITSTSVEPNLMILLDTSGSMSNIVPDSPYDENIDYYNCPSDNEFNTAKQIDIRIRNDGLIYLYRNGYNYDFWQGSLGGANNLTERCFNDGWTYTARLLGDSGGSPSSYLASKYTGNYLNWYFSNSTNTAADDFDDFDKKPGTKTRMEIAKASAAAMVDDLVGMRVGLATYNGSSGAKIRQNIKSIGTSSDITTLKNAINLITNSGSTPLGESLADLGHYFAQRAGGSISGQLTLHPDGIGDKPEKVVNASSFFSHTPSNSHSPTTDVITNWCQDSFIVAMTDGIPTSDTSVSNDMKNYFNGADIVDDVTRAMYEIDLRPDLTEGSLGTPWKNNVITHMVGFADTQVTNNSLIRSAATQGGGEYLTANNSAELVTAFRNVIDSIVDKVAAGSGITFNTSQLTAGTSIYAASFDSGEWSGSLKSYALSGTGEISSTASWDAATKLDNLADYNTRNIFSFNDSTKQGIVFNKTNIDSAPSLLADLQAGPEGSAGVDNLISYLKGNKVNNIGTAATNYRDRASRLGDLVNSTVVYVGAPELDWPDYDSTASVSFGGTGQNYSDYKNTSRTAMLYVGANDGMLHGFSATDGEEKFAYIPSLVASSASEEGLHYLASTGYQHRFYVDSTPTISDVYYGSTWHTVLISGLRSGGKGLFALDITDPTKFDATVTGNADALSLWEFSSANDPDFGYSYSEPTVAKMANGEWAVIVGNGYNNTGDGNAKLFILYIDEGLDGEWSASDYKEIDTGVGADSSGIPNGLSTPRAVDLDGDSVVDRIYAGDLQGNMWAFDVSSSNTNQWKVAHKTGSTYEALFTAKDGNGKAQPITTAPIVADNVNAASGAPDLLVFFGTGKYIEETDKTSTDLMSYYGVLDNGEGAQTRSNLTPRELYSTSTTRVISGTTMTWSNSRGWYFDFEDQANSLATPTNIGERVTSNSLITSNILLFNTVIPTVVNSDICVSNSESWIMAVDLNTGKAPNYTVFDINNNRVFDDTTSIYDIDGDGEVNLDDVTSHAGIKVNTAMIAGDIAILGNTIYSNDVDGNLNEESVRIETTAKQGRLSWEELIQQ